MKTKLLKFHKTIKKNLGNYNMLEAGYGMEIEVGEGETIEEKAIWEHINQVINREASDTDPEWIRQTEK